MQTYSIMPMNSGKDYKARPTEIAQPLMTQPVGGNQGGDYVVINPTIAFQSKASASQSMNPSKIAPTLDKSKAEGTAAMIDSQVRRLTPKEAERLQGFPDDYTAGLSDTQRYRALGNSMAVPVMRYIAEQIEASQ